MVSCPGQLLDKPINNPVPLLKQYDNVCPDNTVCTVNNTCCKGTDGNYSCCSVSNGVCCNSIGYCCPQGYQCDITNNNCWLPPNWHRVAFFNLNPSHKANTLVTCQDKTHCAAGQTCCGEQDNNGGGLGCCALPNAVCCSDMKSCCPAGSKCDEEHGLCLW